jgi:uncharacterized protein involved in exopolysaccharide biosynthesis
MLNKIAWRDAAQHVATDEPVIDIVEAVRALHRQWFLLASVLMLTVGAAVAYLVLTPPRYTATAMLLFDVGTASGIGATAPPSSGAASTYVDSQVEVLKSDAIARSVITKLHLESDPEFPQKKKSLLASIYQFVRSIPRSVKNLIIGNPKSAPEESDPLAPLVAFFQSNLTVKRVGLTYVVEVSYRSLDPENAARISNAVADTYIVAQLDSKYDAASQFGAWLQNRTKELRIRAQGAEKAIAEYKAQNKLDRARSLSQSELATLSGQRSAALKDLESTSIAYRALYEAFVRRATEHQPFPIADARVVSKATPPINKSDPKTLLILATATLLGAVGGASVAFAREHLRAVFVSPKQIEKELGIGCLGIFPALESRGLKPNAPRDGQITDSTSHGHEGAGEPRSRTIFRDPQGYTRAVDDPFSPWSEAVRFLAIDIISLSRPLAVIGVTSALAGEGKSMAAANLAELLADGGRKVLLADCNLRNSELTRRLAPGATKGLSDVIRELEAGLENRNSLLKKQLISVDQRATDRSSQYTAAAKHLLPKSTQAQSDPPRQLAPEATEGLLQSVVCLENFVWRDPVTGLDFLPAPRPLVQSAHPSAALSSSQMQRLLASAHEIYDHVILDLPAILPVADVKALSQLIDGFIIVIKWGQTAQSAVRDALNITPLLADKLLGTVLNRASPSVLERLGSYNVRPN